MKKLIVASLLVLSLVTAQAAAFVTANVTLAVGGNTNVINGGALVDYIILTAPSDQAASVKVYDSPGIWVTYTNAAYKTVTSYATNWVNTWTNYYGATNSVTNTALYWVTNSVAVQTGVARVAKYTLTANTNETVQFSGLNAVFREGVTTTNTAAAGTPVIAIGYNRW